MNLALEDQKIGRRWKCHGGVRVGEVMVKRRRDKGNETLLLQLQKLRVFIGVDCCIMLFSQSDD